MQNGMSALPPKADMCGATRDVRFVPIADMKRLPGTRYFRRMQAVRGRTNPDLGELTRLRIDLDGARVLFHDDIVTDREPKTRAFSRSVWS